MDITNTYNNPALENYTCDGQISLFDYSINDTSLDVNPNNSSDDCSINSNN